MIGIYRITSPTGKIYIGASISIKRRWKAYRKTGFIKSRQRKVIESFNEHGCINHKFEVIEECSKEFLHDKERYWQDFYDVLGENGLNGSLVGGNGKKGIMGEEQKFLFKKNMKIRKLTPEQLNWFIENVAKAPKLTLRGVKKSDDIKFRMAENSTRAKLVLNFETGIYFTSCTSAAFAHNIGNSTLRARLNGGRGILNNTPFKYV